MNDVWEEKARFEHLFWLQILGDHSRFIHDALAPDQLAEIEKSSRFIQVFDSLLEQARSDDSIQIASKAEVEVIQLKEFKLELLSKHLTGKIKIHLPPTFINHMVNELEEYERILSYINAGQVSPIYHELHHHLLWLLDAAGHSDSIFTSLDSVEKSIREKSDMFMKHFEAFYLKAVEMVGYLRTNLSSFPVLEKFNSDTQLEIKLFQHFLQELEELRLTKQALGTFSPLMADHMFREECYYLTKLAESANLEMPKCDPTKPRLKE